MSIRDAAVSASRQRLRPILMTSFAFILGVLPLVVATGAGAAGRVSLGTSVFGGMLTGTLILIFLVPVFFVLVQRFSGHGSSTSPQPVASPGHPPNQHTGSSEDSFPEKDPLNPLES